MTTTTSPSDSDDHQPRFSLFVVGDEVTMVAGPFESFDGTVVEVDPSIGLAVVEINIFGKGQLVPHRFHELSRRQS